MTIDEELSIIQDNIAEYGQTNITQEEYNMIYNKAIDDVLQKMKELKLDEHCPSGCHCSAEQESCPYNECNNDVIHILEQLKGE